MATPSSPVIFFINRINQILKNKNISLQYAVQDLIFYHQNNFDQLKDVHFIELRNHFQQGFGATIFLIVLIEQTKHFDKPLFRPFTLFVSFHLLRSRGRTLSLEDYHQFIEEQYYQPYNIRAELAVRTDKSVDILKKFKLFLKEVMQEDIGQSIQMLMDILKITFETNSQLAFFSKEIGMADIDDVTQYRSDLKTEQKLELKRDMLLLAESHFLNTQRVFNYIKTNAITETGHFNLMQETDLNVFFQKIIFFISQNSTKAFEQLEFFKSSIFLERLSISIDIDKNKFPIIVQQLLQRESILQQELKEIFTRTILPISFEILKEIAQNQMELENIYQELRQFLFPELNRFIQLRTKKKLSYSVLKEYIR